MNSGEPCAEAGTERKRYLALVRGWPVGEQGQDTAGVVLATLPPI